MQNKARNSYNPKSKEILKQLGIDNKPLEEQIKKLEKQINKNEQN